MNSIIYILKNISRELHCSMYPMIFVLKYMFPRIYIHIFPFIYILKNKSREIICFL